MKIKDITLYRLQQQQILRPPFNKPEDVVKRLGAIQAQDYLGSLWAIGLRTKNSTENSIEDALGRRVIIRTWPMRGTLHFVAAADVRWMLKLLAPRIVKAQANRIKRNYELDDKVINQSKKVIIHALQGNRQLTRDGMYKTLEAGKISAKGQRGLHILWRLAQDGILCFGIRQGKQHTFTLLDEWIPATGSLSREESMAELALRYFTGHGPATLQDFIWWSGLPSVDAKTSYEMVKSKLIEEKIAEQVYIMPSNITAPIKHSPSIHLLPSFDEYTVGYTDRSAMLDVEKETNHGNGIFNPILVINGKITGTWKRMLKKESAAMEVKPFSPLGKADKMAIENKVNQYAKFLKLDISSLRFIN